MNISFSISGTIIMRIQRATPVNCKSCGICGQASHFFGKIMNIVHCCANIFAKFVFYFPGFQSMKLMTLAFLFIGK